MQMTGQKCFLECTQMNCEKKGFKVETLGLSWGDEAGVKSVTLKVKGEFAYGYLKAKRESID